MCLPGAVGERMLWQRVLGTRDATPSPPVPLQRHFNAGHQGWAQGFGAGRQLRGAGVARTAVHRYLRTLG